MKIGLIINPIAGVGGPAGLKGSDGVDIQELALFRGSSFQSAQKVKMALEELRSVEKEFVIYTGAGKLGETVVKELGFPCRVYGAKKEKTTSEDTEFLAKVLAKHVELLVFAGGDGTARNIYHAVELSVLCVGIPTGVKIHSAVYGNSPKAAGRLIAHYLNHPESAHVVEREVMDIDEDKFRQDIIEARLYGYLQVPYVNQLMQQSKASVKFSEYDVMGIADEIGERMKGLPAETCFLFGTGGTTYKVMEHLGYAGSLLGVDVVVNQEVVVKDGSEKMVFEWLKGRRVVLIVTIIGGQGHVFGRGNQQISPRVIRQVLPEDIWIVSTADKVYHLPNHTLRVDTSDRELDQHLTGYWKVIVGWQEQIVCPITD